MKKRIMERFESKKTDEKLIVLPGYEINDFLDSRLIQENQKQKNDISKRTSREETDVSKNASNLLPSCEFLEKNKDDSK